MPPITLYLSWQRSSQQDSSCNDQGEDKARLGLGHNTVLGHRSSTLDWKKQLVKVVDPPLGADLATGHMLRTPGIAIRKPHPWRRTD